MSSPGLDLHPDRLLPSEPGLRRLARDRNESVARLPIVYPHGHVPAARLAEGTPFAGPSSLLVTPDHDVTRMLPAQGWSAEEQSRGLFRRYRSVAETSGFIEDTRASCSGPARHDRSRRLAAGHLAGLVGEHPLDEGEALETLHDLVATAPRRAFRL